ncbi:hypothetical protein GH714_027505 [Hevea brasiliensis]|uniref:TIR domain-containing protein n=1 Tax=Hevea brasiliensis TaxID=3981 RepID=A0A6A6NKP0_HEVBR|nr:hypothetical protein GH714_027505 [Hevea brasiliensis]
MSQGDEIAPSLLDAIEDSAASIIMLSPNYANSHWCLEELATICQLGRLILPVFYDVDPSNVRKQTGHFEKDFSTHTERFGEEKVKKWRKAMQKVGGISGLPYDNSKEQQLIRKLVKRVLTELKRTVVSPVHEVDAGITLIKQKLPERRLLAVLDDVDDVSQLNALAVNRNWFCEGSVIIITTRNKHVLVEHLVNEVHEVTEFNFLAALNPNSILKKVITKIMIVCDNFLAYLKEKWARLPSLPRGEEKQGEIILSTSSFESMVNLRLLQINRVKLEGKFKYFPGELKWLQWKECPLRNLPSDYHPSRLAILDLSESGIQRVWGWGSNKVAEKLMVMNLRHCHNLVAIPDLYGYKTLEKLDLERCIRLTKIHKSVGNLRHCFA